MPSARPEPLYGEDGPVGWTDRKCVRCGAIPKWRVSAYDVMRLRDVVEYACTAHVGHIIDGLPGRQGVVEGIR